MPAFVTLTAFSPGEAVYGTGIPNPLAVEALRPVSDALRPYFLTSYIGLMFAVVASLVGCLVRSEGEERQQIKWFVYAAAFVPVWFVFNARVERAAPALFGVLDSLVISGVPVAADIAILRYRELVRVVRETMQPAQVSLSLRPGPASEDEHPARQLH